MSENVKEDIKCPGEQKVEMDAPRHEDRRRGEEDRGILFPYPSESKLALGKDSPKEDPRGRRQGEKHIQRHNFRHRLRPLLRLTVSTLKTSVPSFSLSKVHYHLLTTAIKIRVIDLPKV